MELLELGKVFALKIEELGGKKVDLLDVSKKTNQAKYFILCNFNDESFSKEASLKIQAFALEQHLFLNHLDGQIKGEWIVLDFVDIIVHIFTEKTRTKFNLDKLWKDSKNAVKLNETKK